jgi:hypothetical protein
MLKNFLKSSLAEGSERMNFYKTGGSHCPEKNDSQGLE